MNAEGKSPGLESSGPSGSGLSRGEVLRKLVHMSVGFIAFAVRPLGPVLAALCALTALLFNLFVLPRIGGRSLWRESETARGMSLGIVFYPLTVLILILAFHQRLEVAAGVWGILAFGDGMASLVGMAFGRHKLPWNPGKSWLGSLAYILFGTLACAVLVQWTAPGRYSLAFAVAVSFGAALFAAILESQPQGLDDNIGVPLLTGLWLFCLLLAENAWTHLLEPELASRLAIAAAVNLVLALAGYAARSVNLSGMIGGFLIGTAIYACLGWQGYLLLLTFFILGTACTKLGYRRKAERGLAQEGGGRRGARHAVANTGVAAACALFALITPHGEIFAIAFAAAFATASSDTVSSEIGQLWGRRTFLITTLRPVPPGTEGAVSMEGTLAGIAASALVAVLGAVLGLFGPGAVLVVTVAAFVGTTLESLAGATLERRGLLDNEAINFLNTLVGALTAAALVPLLP